jgi:hypothetical protein
VVTLVRLSSLVVPEFWSQVGSVEDVVRQVSSSGMRSGALAGGAGGGMSRLIVVVEVLWIPFCAATVINTVVAAPCPFSVLFACPMGCPGPRRY